MMVRRGLFVAALFTALFALNARAVELKTPEEARDYANQIVVDIGQNRLNEAWAKMKSNSTIPPGRIDAFADNYTKAVQQTLKYYGPSIGMELLAAEISGESLLRLTYLVKYEVTGVSWFLTFYKGRDKWVLTDFNYDININSIFQQ